MPLPEGPIPKVEAQWSHREFVEAVRPDTVLTTIVKARQLCKRGEDADSYYGEDVDVIVTTTVRDEKLRMITWEKEADIVREFAPAYHIPTDYSIYDWHSRRERVENLEEMVEGTLWMRDQLADTDTRILPQVKGFTKPERKATYAALDAFEEDYAVYYATQYFTDGSPNQIDVLADDLETIKFERNLDLLVIGLLSPNYVARVPDNVVAVSGLHNWRKRVTPRDSSAADMRAAYDKLVEATDDALGPRDG